MSHLYDYIDLCVDGPVEAMTKQEAEFLSIGLFRFHGR